MLCSFRKYWNYRQIDVWQFLPFFDGIVHFAMSEFHKNTNVFLCMAILWVLILGCFYWRLGCAAVEFWVADHVASFKSLQAKCHCSDVAMSSFDYFEVRYQARRLQWIIGLKTSDCQDVLLMLFLRRWNCSLSRNPKMANGWDFNFSWIILLTFGAIPIVCIPHNPAWGSKNDGRNERTGCHHTDKTFI